VHATRRSIIDIMSDGLRHRFTHHQEVDDVVNVTGVDGASSNATDAQR
jgi:hypothetical protein